MPLYGNSNYRNRRKDLNTAAYRRASRRLRTTNNICWLCEQEIDIDLDRTHPMSWTADHVEPVSTGGNPRGELRPAHRSCNSRKGNRTSAPPAHNHEPGDGPERFGGRKGIPWSRAWFGDPNRFDADGYLKGSA